MKSKAINIRPDADESGQTFTDDFWENIDAAFTAVGNLKTRNFIDSKCVFYSKRFFDAGISGTKCSIQIIILYQTQTYTDLTDPLEMTFPMSSIKNFPLYIEEAILWAKDYFSTTFFDNVEEYVKYAANPAEYFTNLQQEHRVNIYLQNSRVISL